MAKSKTSQSSQAAAIRRHEYWREILRRWQASGLSQAAFCRRRGISVWKFAWWRKRLREQVRRGEGKGRGVAPGGLLIPANVAPCSATRSGVPRVRDGRRNGRGAARGGLFVPVGIASSAVDPVAWAASSTSELELTLSNSRLLRFSAEIDAAKLAKIVTVLEQAAGPKGANPC